jgi:hypothetical protein
VRRFKEVVVPLTLEAEREYGRELKRQSLASGRKIDKEAFEKFKAEIGPKVKCPRTSGGVDHNRFA